MPFTTLILELVPATAAVGFTFKWFLQVTDISVRYNWAFKGTRFSPSQIRPQLAIRNHSRSRTYVLAGIEYRTKGNHQPLHIDNHSLWGKEIKPGTLQHFDDIATVDRITSLTQAFQTEVHTQLQTGRRYWLKAQGPDQKYIRSQRIAFWLREKLSNSGLPIE